MISKAYVSVTVDDHGRVISPVTGDPANFSAGVLTAREQIRFLNQGFFLGQARTAIANQSRRTLRLLFTWSNGLQYHRLIVMLPVSTTAAAVFLYELYPKFF